METQTRAAESEVLSVATLQQRCDGIERDVLFRRLVAPDALTVMRPGGPQNADQSVQGWLVYLLHLTRVHATAGGATGTPAAVESELELNDALGASLSNTPEFVRFDDGVMRAIHAKSYHTLEFLDQLDTMLRFSAKLMLQHADLDRFEDIPVQVNGRALRSKAVRVWLWVLAHPGAGLPFDESRGEATPPKWTGLATPEDVLRVADAHLTVNRRRNQIIAAAFPPDPAKGTTRLSLAGFIGAMAQESGHQPSELMRRWSLGELLAQSVVAARAAKEAEENAKRRPRMEH